MPLKYLHLMEMHYSALPGGNKMKKKLICIFVLTLLIVTILPITGSVIAGDENDPEIVDDENDVIGPNGNIIAGSRFNHIDVISAWFFEKQSEPKYLFTSLKVINLRPSINTVYGIFWRYNDIGYATIVSNDLISWLLGRSILVNLTTNSKTSEISCSIDQKNNIITFKTPKELIGNPQSGEKLTNTMAGTSVQFGVLLSPNVYFIWQDRGPDSGPGSDYTIQY